MFVDGGRCSFVVGLLIKSLLMRLESVLFDILSIKSPGGSYCSLKSLSPGSSLRKEAVTNLAFS